MLSAFRCRSLPQRLQVWDCGRWVGGGRRWRLEVEGGVDGEAFVRHLFR